MQTHHKRIINAGRKVCNTVRSARVSWGCQSKPGRMDIIEIEPWCVNSIYDQFKTMATVDEIINANASKAPWRAKN